MQEWLRQNHTNQDFLHINSGIGGSMSWYDLFRFDADVRSANPKVIFLDMSVNDLDAPIYQKSAEALTRLCIATGAKVVGVLLGRWADVATNDDTNTYANQHTSIKAIFDNYGIDYADVATAMQADVPGNNDLTDWYATDDGVHPLNAGHTYIAGKVEAELSSIAPVGALTTPIYDTNGDYSNTPITRDGTDNDGETGTGWSTNGTARQSSTANDTISFAGTFQSFGLNQDGGTGTYQWSVDGGAYSASLSSSSLNGIDLGVSRGSHTVTIKVISGTVVVSEFRAI